MTVNIEITCTLFRVRALAAKHRDLAKRPIDFDFTPDEMMSKN